MIKKSFVLGFFFLIQRERLTFDPGQEHLSGHTQPRLGSVAPDVEQSSTQRTGRLVDTEVSEQITPFMLTLCIRLAP